MTDIHALLQSLPVSSRREWLMANATALMASKGISRGWTPAPGDPGALAARSEVGRAHADVTAWEGLAQRAVDAAKAAGASYADARLTRTVQHLYRFGAPPGNYFSGDMEMNGAGVRVLVNGYWGFAAAPRVDDENVVRLARAAVAQAKVNALGVSRAATLASGPVARGRWATPMRIDPFSISIEEKNDYITSWIDLSVRLGVAIDTIRSRLQFARQERTVATSDGALFTQRLYESGGYIACTRQVSGGGEISAIIDGIEATGKGWEIFPDAKIPDQLAAMDDKLRAQSELHDRARPITIGRYTLVCDGATMASLLDQTLGLATQLDRALGYEANASGTSYLDDPMQMLGTFQAASPLVTVTANRSAAAQLATVKWDDEGVEPKIATLVKDGILNDFQTTREQASWLAPFYEKHGRPVASHGYAASEMALKIPMQQAPNLALTPSAGGASVDDLIANVPNGLLVTGGFASTDFQARNGTLFGSFRKITNGRLGNALSGGAVLFSTNELWRQVAAVAGERTQATIASSQYPFGSMLAFYGYTPNIKGQPPQITSHSVTAPAATITAQAIVDPTRKA